jgi:hypothetical protein
MPAPDEIPIVRVATVLAAIIITLAAVISVWQGASSWIARRQTPGLVVLYFPIAAINLWYHVAEPPSQAASWRARPMELVLLALFLLVFVCLFARHGAHLDELLLPLFALIYVVSAGHWPTRG